MAPSSASTSAAFKQSGSGTDEFEYSERDI